MNIDKAISHFEFRLVEKDSKGKIKLKNNLKPNLNDLKAYNAIIDYKETQDNIAVAQNESLCKLFIHQFILMCQTKLYTSETALKSINDILDQSVSSWVDILRNEIPMLRFNSVGSHKYPIDEKDVWNITKRQERDAKIIDEFETELTSALKTQITKDQVIKWVESNVNRIINKYDK